jgi:hypothetical protein
MVRRRSGGQGVVPLGLGAPPRRGGAREPAHAEDSAAR